MPATSAVRRLAHVVVILLLVNVFAASAAVPFARAETGEPINIVAFGDSLFAGFGLRASQAFPAQLQKELKANGHNVIVTDAAVSGDTTARGLERLEWAVPKGADAVILELGANDALLAVEPAVTRANLEKIIAALKQRGLPILLVGMLSPANWGDHYSEDFDAIFPELAQKHGLLFYPFVLDGIVFDRKLNLNDGMHPSSKGIAEMVKRMLPSVEELIAKVPPQGSGAPKS